VKEFVDQNPGGVFGPVNDNGFVGTRIGVAPVYVEGLRDARMFRKLARGGVGAEIDRVRTVVLFIFEQGQHAAPQVPRNVLSLCGIRQKRHDGPDEVLKRTREQLRNGASQVKLMAGGGVSSSYDPLDVTQYSPAELSAAVSAAENWGTYVSVHAYTPKAIRTAIDAGVKCIEHGQLIDDATAKLLAEKGTWWSLQPFVEDPAAPSAFAQGLS
jgi:imidazolonepropionase-like amidohydrolase